MTETQQLSHANTHALTKPKRLTHADKLLIKQRQATYSALKDEARTALSDYQRCMNNFNFIQDEKLIDVCIYDIQQTMTRYEYLVTELKRIPV